MYDLIINIYLLIYVYATARTLCYSHIRNLTCITARNYVTSGADCCTRVWTSRVLLCFYCLLLLFYIAIIMGIEPVAE